MHVVNWSELSARDVEGGVTKTALDGANGSLVRVEIPAGFRAARHSHPHEQIVHIVDGTGSLTTEEGAKTFMAGTLFHFPAGTWHEAVFETPTILVETNFRS